MSELTIFVLIVLAILGTIGFYAGKFGYRLGVKHATGRIVRHFESAVSSTDNDLKNVPALLNQRGLLSDHTLWEIADKLQFAAWNYGMECQARSSAPKAEEASLTMEIKELSYVAWLADMGFEAWISPIDTFRIGERPSYEEAERVAGYIETFERRIVPNLLTESPESKETRFTSSENRTHGVWVAYGKL